jgi:CSLREA domain-containing protein
MNNKYYKSNSLCTIVVALLTVVILTLFVADRLVRSAPAVPAGQGSAPSVPDAATTAAIRDRYGDLPLRFEPNQGQTDPQVRFLSRGPGYDLFLTPTEAVLTLRKPQSPSLDRLEAAPTKDVSSASLREASVLRLRMLGANPEALVEGREELSGKVNYLIGNAPDKWHVNIPIYGKVYYKETYPGVDMIYYGNQQQLEYDFVLAPHADPRSVKFKLEGAQQLKVDGKGDLVITIDHSEVRLRKPLIYQVGVQGERHEVRGSYALRGSEISFEVKNYDARKALIIDPVLSYSTYFGPAATALAITVDASGNAYLTGSATSAIFPTTAGSLKPSSSQDIPDAFVTKLNSSGTALIYSTFLGGSSQDVGNGIAVDSSGNAFVTGDTQSANFPTVNPIRSSTSNFLQTVDTGGHWSGQFIGPPNGVVNVLVVDPLAPNTMYAGMGSNGGTGVYKSTDGGVNWVGLNTGLTGVNCSALVIDPTTPSTLYAGLNSNTASGLYKSVDGGLTWAKLINGIGGFMMSALAIDPSSPSTVYAGTSSVGLYKSTNSGASWTRSDTGINFGGINSIAVDPASSAIVYASAGGGGVFKTTNGGGNWGQVNTGLTNTSIRVLRIDTASNLYAGSSGGGLFKTTNGGGNWSPLNNGLPNFTSVSSLALSPGASTIFMGTPEGRIYKSIDDGANWTISYETLTRTSFNSLVLNPTNSAVVYAGASIQVGSLNDHEAFIARLNPNGSALVYSTYLGGNKDDIGRGVAVDSAGNTYVTGQTASATFPLAAAFQSALRGTQDAFVTVLNPAGTALVYSTFLGGDNSETANAIAIDSGGNAYVTGNTLSTNFPLANAFQSTLGAQFSGDAFATKFSSTGALAYSTYLGGDGTDVGNGVAADSSGNAYITGLTTSTNYPTANAIQPSNGGSAGDAFVTKLNNLGSSLVYSTYLGGSNIDSGRGIAIDSAGNAYVTGFTNSPEFPVVAGALRTKSAFYTTTNSGGSWSNDNYGLKGGGVTCLAIDPLSPSTLYAGTGSGGVFKTTDGGRNWSPINNGLGNLRMTEVVVDPITPANLYAASYDTSGSGANGIYKSTNGGNSWTRVNNGITNTSVMSLAIDPLTPTTLYAGPYGGPIYKTTNSGGSWAPSGNPSIGFAVSIAIDPVTPATLYAADVMSGGGIFKSIDAGVTWQQVGFSQTGPYGSFVAVSPLNPSKVFAVSNSGLFKSVDSGANWTLVGPYAFVKVVFDPVNASTIYLVTTSQGILRSTNDGQSWNPINNGINSANPSSFYAAMSTSNDNDAFVTKINQSGSAFIYSTLLGGNPAPGDSSNLNDEGYGIAVDPSGNAYVTGSTRSLDFPTTPDSYLPVPAGGAFVSKLTMSYLISGQVLDGSNAPVSGAEITLSDGASLASTITGSDGFYQFSQLREGGSFTVSAAKPHFTMTPASQTFNNLNSNQTLNFIATATNAPFYSVSGTVTNNGVGLTGVTVTLGGSQPGIRTTDVNGAYSFTLSGGGNYTVTPSLLGFSFSPASLVFNNLASDQTAANFTASRQLFVVTNANDHGAGSLRQAMLDANATAGADTIVFNIPGGGVQTINLSIALPEITDPVVIDAATQPGYASAPLVELNGSLAGTGSGFSITAGGSTIRGFAIGRFSSGAGITLKNNGNNVIQGNYVGLDATGTLRRGNNRGIELSSCSNNVIGGTSAAARNVISSNSFQGISITGSDNQITGNFIGTNAAGTAGLGNGINGVEIFNIAGPASTNNVIGGSAAGAGNLISGNQTGVSVNSSGTVIQGNLIGTDYSGTLAIANGTGINASAANTVIGGLTAGSRNVISGNNGDGVAFGGLGSSLQGNFIGTDITGTITLGNGGSGVVTGNGALVGGTTPAARNVISGNHGFGNISLGSNNAGAQATVQGNFIGTDLTGTIALTNPLPGISISGSGNLIGGLVPGAQNVISGNQVGIQIGGSISTPPTSNLIQGNLIGLNALGTGAVPNAFGGIRISDASSNVIGGDQVGAANKISFNIGPGINVSSGVGNKLRGNAIFSNGGLGIDLTPDGVTANDVGDADTGANNLQNFPVLTLVSANGGGTAIQGTLNSKPNTVFQIDFYSNGACDSSGNGEGALFFDTTNVPTDANGNATINFMSSFALASGRVLIATATDPTGNTSEFSPCDATNAAGSLQFNTASYNMREEVGSATITVIRTGGSKGTLSVNYSSADGTATAGSDYTAVSGTLVFADGETSKIFGVPIVNDGVTEPAETARLVLTAPDVETLGSQPSATLTILGNDTPLVLTADEVTVPEGTANAVVTVTLSAGTSQTVTVNFATANDTAIGGADFTAVSGTLTFPPGTTSQTINIPIINDNLDENDEDFGVVLSNPANASIQDSGFVIITDDDPLPSVSISDVSVTEGNSGTVSAVFNLSLSAASGRDINVFFQTANGTATAGSDYVSRSSSTIVQAGQTAKTISVTVNGDITVEPDETFFLNLTFVGNGIAADSQGLGTIINDDAGFVVNSTGDGSDNNPGNGLCNDGTGFCTLRAAIQEANALSGAETITFAAAVTGSISLNTALPDISGNLSIVGPGVSVLTVQRSTAGGTPNFRIFKINSGTTVAVSGLTISNGRTADGVPAPNFGSPGDSGGGILNAGTLTLSDVVVTGNHTGNGAPPSSGSFGGAGGSGAGIWSSGSLSMSNVTISNNTTGGGATANFGGGGGSGAGLYVFSGTLTMTNCQVSGNVTADGAIGTGAGASSGGGGSGAGIYIRSGNATLTSLIVSNNTTGGTAVATPDNSGSGGFGGGIFVEAGNVSLLTSTISGNHTGDGIGFAGQGGFGGGIFNGGTLTVRDTLVNGNSAGASGPNGGGVGGGIDNSGTLTMTNSTISGNSTTGAGGNGAGLWNAASATLANCSVVFNSSFSTFGGAGIHQFNSSSVVNIRNTIVAHNSLSGDPNGTDLDSTQPYISQGHNLIRNADGSSGFNASDQLGTALAPLDPKLGPLANNGGPTMTHALLPNSPALDAGDSCVFDNTCAPAFGFSLVNDQRGAGFSRKVDGADADVTDIVDIGAYEAQVSVADIADQTINEDGSLSLPFNVGGAASITSVTATSSNTALVPNSPANISISGSGSSRTLQVSPVANASGTSTITVTVNGNNSQTMTDTFVLTVNSVNDAPSFTKGADQTVNENTVAQTINNWASNISAGPAAEAGQTVNFVIVSNSNASLFAVTPAVSPAGTLTYTPALGASGTALITIALMDNGGTANGGLNTSPTQSFNITVLDGGALQFSAASLSVAEDGGNAVITVNRSGGTAGEARINYATSNGTATAGQDYTATSGTLIFPDGITSKTFNVAVTNDVVDEPDETINLTLMTAAGSGSLGSPASAVLTITDNDPAPSISINDVAVTEGNGGTVNAVFTVTLSGQSSQTVTVNFATANGTATAGSDYQAASGTLTFLPLETTKPVTVTVNGDTSFEANENFSVNLSTPVNASLSDNQGNGTITNDDVQGGFISFSQANYTAGESAGFTTVTVTRSNDLSGPATVDYATAEDTTVVPCATANGIASSRCDFTTALGTLRFAGGESSKTFLVLISQDNYVEGPETLTLTLSNLTGGAALATPATATLTITDDATEPAGNPIDTADAFVRQHYHDFLNREADAAGLAFWTNQITECQQPGATCSAEVRRINVSAAFFLSIEFQETGYFVYRTYKVSYGNIAGTPVPLRFAEFLPDTQQIGKDVVVGQPGAEQQLENNKVAYMQEFVARSRFTSAYPTSLTPAEFVDALFAYAAVTPSAAERNAAIGEFGGAGNTTDTAARARALRRAAENSTLNQQETNKAFVLMQYFGYLRRNPNDPPEANLDFGGYNFWLGKLNEFNGNFVNAEMVKAFLVSGEYRQRFGP